MANIICDLHNDLPSILYENKDYDINNFNNFNHTDIPRLIKGGVVMQFFTACPCKDKYLDQPFLHSMNMLKGFEQQIKKSSLINLAVKSDEVNLNIRQGKISAILAVEGGHAIEDSIENLEKFYNLGVRYLTITWNNSNNWAVSAMDEKSNKEGLTEFGREVIKKMNALGMMIDVAHTGIQCVKDILEVSTVPVMASHTGVRKLNNHPRNLFDYQIKEITSAGGLIGIVFYPPFLHATGSANLEVVIDHIVYIADIVGVDSLALGSDFDGIGTNTVKELDDVSKYPLLLEALNQRGFTRDEIHKIIFKNSFDFFSNICG